MKVNLPNRISGLGLDVPLWMYEGDNYFYHDYFRSYRNIIPQGETPVPASPETVAYAPGYNAERVTSASVLSAQDIAALPAGQNAAAPAAADTSGLDTLKILSLILVVAGRVL